MLKLKKENVTCKGNIYLSEIILKESLFFVFLCSAKLQFMVNSRIRSAQVWLDPMFFNAALTELIFT